MATTWSSADVGCPFYSSDKADRIVCEGIFYGSMLHNIFENKSDKDNTFRLRCCGDYEGCHVYRENMDKYTEKSIRFTIPLAPITKKNSQRILRNKKTGKLFIAPSENYERYENDAMFFLPKDRVQTACEVKCVFYMPTHRRVDLVNLLEAVDDILVKGGLLADDNCEIIVSHDGSRVKYDKDNPRTEVEIKTI